MRLSLLIALIGFGISGIATAGEEGLLLETDKPFYTIGERVTITGDVVTEEDYDGIDYAVTVLRNGRTLFTDEVEFNGPDMDNRWSWRIRSSDTVTPGIYTIRFTVTSGPDGFNNEIEVVVVASASSGRIVVRTTQRDYASGEAVTFYAINRTSRNRSMPSIAPWKILTARNVPVFEPVNALLTPSSLSARGGRQMWTWDQRSLSGQPVAPGNYKVRVTLGTAQSPEHLYRSFWILADQQ